MGVLFLPHNYRGLAQALLAAVAAAAFAGTAPSIDQVRLSPNGERVLAIANSVDGAALITSDLTSGQRSVALDPARGKQILDGCGWASNERIVCSMLLFQERPGAARPFPRRHLRRLVALDMDGGARVALLDSPPSQRPKFGGVGAAAPRSPWEDQQHVVVDYLPAQPNFVLVAAARQAMEYRSVYRVDVRDGSAERIVGWHAGVVFWSTDHRGKVRLGTGWYEHGADGPTFPGIPPIVEPFLGPTAVTAVPGGGFKRLDVVRLSAHTGPEETAGPRVLGFSADGSRVYVEARVDDADRTAVWEAEAETLEPLRAVVQDALRDVAATAIGAAGCGVAGFAHPLPGRPFTWLDGGMARSVGRAAAKISFEVVAVDSMSADCQRLVLAATDGHSQRTFHWLDRASGAVRQLGGQRSVAADGPRITHHGDAYRTRDGRRLPVVLTRPATSAPPPVVFLLDGAPARGSSAPLDAWPGLFAAKGYAVVQPVVRGMRGYGTALYVAGLKDGAAKLRDDVQDALSWVDAHGFGDVRRTCFLGRGRGGHFALIAAMAASGVDRRCAALYAVMDARMVKRTHHNPRLLGGVDPCCDWLRWAAPEALPSAGRLKLAEEMFRHLVADKTSDLRSPLLDATHPGFPVLVRSDGNSVVHEADSSRFRAHLKALGDFQHIAPRGSASEAAFLADAEALFAEVLGGNEDADAPG